jgi:hypothetical protein
MVLNLNEVVMKIDEAEMLWILGMLPNEQIPEIAMNALENGLDCNELRMIAGMTKAETGDASSLFETALRSLGRKKLTKIDAFTSFVISISYKIVSRQIAAYKGARMIWDASVKSSIEMADIGPFIYAASEYEDRPKDQEFFEKEIFKEAERWIMKDHGRKSRTSP